MNKKYFLTGEINNRPIKCHSFKTEEKAIKSLSKILLEHNLQVEEDREKDQVKEFYCDYHTRFFIGIL